MTTNHDALREAQRNTREAQAFADWVDKLGYDAAYTCDSFGRWIFLNPVTSDFWMAWCARADAEFTKVPATEKASRETSMRAIFEALEPFAKLFQSLQSDFDGPLPATFDATISTEDVRRAAYALSQPPAPEQASVEYRLGETDIYDFAGWLTTRKVVMPVGSTCDAAPMAEAVGEYIKTFPERFAATPTAEPAAPEAAKPEPQAQAGEPEAWGVWLDGEPPHPWREEWFIAETIYGDRVVLRYMGDDMSYQYKTADETYMAAKNIKRWMQFPDGQYISAATKAIAKRDAALQACVEALEAINKECFSHVDGRDLFAQMHPRNTLDIKRRVDARETWFEGDWLTDLWGQIKKSRAAIQQAEEARK